MSYPTDYKYTKEHEWISVAGASGTEIHSCSLVYL